jgi:hypothetical protein
VYSDNRAHSLESSCSHKQQISTVYGLNRFLPTEIRSRQ